jgi:hypothetical protein
MAQENPFERLRVQPGDEDRSIKWFRQQIKDLSQRSITPQSLINQSTELLTKRIIPGNLYLYYYDPKFKEELPFYDTFPLVYPYRKTPDGFIGYNLHYLPPMIRFKIMGLLMNIQQSRDSEKKKIAYSYGILNSSELNKYFAPCIKRYLAGNIRSNFLQIPYDSWLHAALLPTEKFVKANKTTVWKNTLDKV